MFQCHFFAMYFFFSFHHYYRVTTSGSSRSLDGSSTSPSVPGWSRQRGGRSRYHTECCSLGVFPNPNQQRPVDKFQLSSNKSLPPASWNQKFRQNFVSTGTVNANWAFHHSWLGSVAVNWENCILFFSGHAVCDLDWFMTRQTNKKMGSLSSTFATTCTTSYLCGRTLTVASSM